MKIICAGFSRTGTKTVAACLRHFGYKVYDFEEHYFYHSENWFKILNHGWTKEDFYEMYKNVDAVTDHPAAYFWEEILEAFPEAKVIFMERTDDDDWVDSLQTAFTAFGSRPLMAYLSVYLSPTALKFRNNIEYASAVIFGMTNYQVSRFWKRRFIINKQVCKARYKEHNQRVKKYFQLESSGKFLKLNLNDGWKPLCDFIGEDVPNIPFPHLNKKGSLIKNVQNEELVKQITKEMLISSAAISVALSLAVYLNRNQVLETSKTAWDWIMQKWNNI